MTIRPTDPRLPAVAALLAESDATMARLYPAESNHLEGVDALCAPHVHFVGCWVDGALVGCGAVKRLHDADGAYGEIKRVFVQPAWRGRGHSLAVMAALEAHLLSAGVPLARLETGIHQPEALGLYRRLGYQARAPFGAYRPDPLSLFLEKRLGG
jgi:putative acetyltransferase